jgi:proteasome activator subunit 4
VYAASGEQPVLDRRCEELTAAEQEVDLFFSDLNNIDRLIKFLALEEKKGKDKFNCFRFLMFKVRQCFAVNLFLCFHCYFDRIVTEV